MKLQDVGTYYRQQIEKIGTLENTLWQGEASELLTRLATDTLEVDNLLALMHGVQRLGKIATAGLAHNEAFRTAVAAAALPAWRDFTAPEAGAELQYNLADKLYNIKDTAKDVAFLTLGDGARMIGVRLIEKCMEDKVRFLIQFDDPGFNALVLNHAADEGIAALAADFLAMTEQATKRIVAVPGLPEEEPIRAEPAKLNQYRKAIERYSERVRSGDLFFTLTVIPTRRDAEIDGIPYDEYITLFFEMCDQPWRQIGKAQEALIAEFNAARTARFTNNDGTDITMDIAGFTFCNSLIAKNVPGSEIFSAPRRDSVNGKVVAKGRFEHANKIIENLTMEFENGYLARYSADSGIEVFEEAISIDEGARYVGEIGIGTNPHFKQHVANGLLVEKIGGSFHLALGAAYTMTEYEGVKVKVDNGNQSALHWDITTMLYGKGGRIYLDGRLVMDDGRFLDSRYDVLNRGWEAVSEHERPDYWKSRARARA